MESNVAESPNSLAEALDLVEFDISEVLTALSEAELAVYDELYSADYRLVFTFRVHPNKQENYPKRSGWVEMRCDLTGMSFAVPKLAPVPQLLLFREEALEEVFVVHPDFLNDRSDLSQMIVSKIEEDLISALYEARRAAAFLDEFSTYDDLPGLPAEDSVSYPTDQGWEAIGNRPLDLEEE